MYILILLYLNIIYYYCIVNDEYSYVYVVSVLLM